MFTCLSIRNENTYLFTTVNIPEPVNYVEEFEHHGGCPGHSLFYYSGMYWRIMLADGSIARPYNCVAQNLCCTS